MEVNGLYCAQTCHLLQETVGVRTCVHNVLLRKKQSSLPLSSLSDALNISDAYIVPT